jgi:hypothetical protein
MRCLFTPCQSLPNFCHHQAVVSQSAALNNRTLSTLECCLLSIKIWSIWLCIFPSDVQVNWLTLQCGNILLLAIRFLDVAKFTTLTPLTLQISCKLSFPIVGLKTSSLPTSALKSRNKISYGI